MIQKKIKNIFSKKQITHDNFTANYRTSKNKMEIYNLSRVDSLKSTLGFKNYFSKVIDFAKKKKINQIYFKTHIFYNHPNLYTSLKVRTVNPEAVEIFYKKLKERGVIKTLDFYSKYSFLKGQKYYLKALDKKNKLIDIEILEKELPIYVLEI